MQGSASIGSSVCLRHIAFQEIHPSHVSLLAESASAVSSRFSGSDAVVFPLPFGGWPSLLGTSCSRCGYRHSLRSAYLGEVLSGVSTFRIGEVRPGGALPILRGLGVREHGGNEPCPLTHPPLSSIHGGSSMTKPQEEFTCVRPFGLSLACGSMMVGCSWAYALGFGPRRYQRRTPG